MTFSFPAYHTEEIEVEMKPAELRRAVCEALESLGWSISKRSKEAISASTGINLLSWGEQILIEFGDDGSVSITSKCSLPTQCFDWGKNKSNVLKLIDELEES